MAGILNHAAEMTYYMNPTENSYVRLGLDKAPKNIFWGNENRLALIRVPAATNSESKRLEVRSADCECNIYIVLTLLINAALDGIKNNLLPPEEGNNTLSLPDSLEEAKSIAQNSDFIKNCLDF